MEEDKLIYIDDYEITENSQCIITFEVVDEKALISIENGEFLNINSLEVNLDLVSPEELDNWNNTFVYFDKFDLVQNGFANAQKGGNKTNARKLNNIFRKLKEEMSRFVLNSIEEPNGDINNLNKHWFYCVLNVGRGESNLVITPNGKLYLFDGGDSKQKVSQKITNVVNHINCFPSFSIEDQISGVFISHPDNDHFRGVVDVLDTHSLSQDCFIYYNYHGHYPKPNWVTALKKIKQSLTSNKLNHIVHIPEKKDLSDLSALLPYLYFSTAWPYDIGKNISKINGYNVNDSSHCFYVGQSQSSLVFNLFGDIEKKGWEINGDLPYASLNNGFIFKPSHHGRKSGDPKVNFSGISTVNSHIDSKMKKTSIFPNYVSSANDNVGHLYSSLAEKATLSTSTSNAIIYIIGSKGPIFMWQV
ncbi:hypothetical protein QUO16_004639 [Vibrio parahaemolyticus]|uniref:hypothetical protein n=3 Tax=Vibrio parahaemolyticus TaxID=670 RepID=UPI000A37B9AF|nr:hypothetical protein [Vibrio parahaemolyticus]ELA9373312.1 hypothetical protein [Vibrio parahaemolyticus]OUJ46563.1 hypothetical protein BTM22_25285 [Vibrio parahaemolyticus]HCG8707549.1 hypothetical protein [Vibrio parahaemolyticus]